MYDAASDEKSFYKQYRLREKEALIRLRFLDYQVQQSNFIPTSTLSNFPIDAQNCIITENEINFLTLPRLSGTFAIWGEGFAVEALQQVKWLNSCQLCYWGDIDAHGFEILSRLRGLFPAVIAVMMDAITLNRFESFVLTGTRSTFKTLGGLTAEERHLYEKLVAQNWRLEQEHIPQSYVIDTFTALGLTDKDRYPIK